jgi:nickel-dependent lactate racemase
MTDYTVITKTRDIIPIISVFLVRNVSNENNALVSVQTHFGMDDEEVESVLPMHGEDTKGNVEFVATLAGDTLIL